MDLRDLGSCQLKRQMPLLKKPDCFRVPQLISLSSDLSEYSTRQIVIILMISENVPHAWLISLDKLQIGLLSPQDPLCSTASEKASLLQSLIAWSNCNANLTSVLYIAVFVISREVTWSEQSVQPKTCRLLDRSHPGSWRSQVQTRWPLFVVRSIRR